ncbi:hypothetical protein DSO57_1013333 [Entomophthora muscae]|uniref:Uncharacterized protein n=1 Tax=Entomophthora muscae TaxID=34485 RepID=A0ACC2UQI1_9FUNG|nr:hypothetical protein DSO57_1013333 [Entomophthora muscae]
MQAKYKLLTNHSLLLGNDKSSKPALAMTQDTLWGLYNYLPAYQTDIEALPTPKPDHQPPTPGLTPPTASQYTGIAYITLAGLVDTMVSAAELWALVGQSAYYHIKLEPLIWWALPSSQQSKLAAEANRPSPGTRYPATYGC